MNQFPHRESFPKHRCKRKLQEPARDGTDEKLHCATFAATATARLVSSMEGFAKQQCARAETRPLQALMGVYSKVSFAIEPIQLPIVPLNWFS